MYIYTRVYALQGCPDFRKLLGAGFRARWVSIYLSIYPSSGLEYSVVEECTSEGLIGVSGRKVRDERVGGLFALFWRDGCVWRGFGG